MPSRRGGRHTRRRFNPQRRRHAVSSRQGAATDFAGDVLSTSFDAMLDNDENQYNGQRRRHTNRRTRARTAPMRNTRRAPAAEFIVIDADNDDSEASADEDILVLRDIVRRTQTRRQRLRAMRRQRRRAAARFYLRSIQSDEAVRDRNTNNEIIAPRRSLHDLRGDELEPELVDNARVSSGGQGFSNESARSLNETSGINHQAPTTSATLSMGTVLPRSVSRSEPISHLLQDLVNFEQVNPRSASIGHVMRRFQAEEIRNNQVYGQSQYSRYPGNFRGRTRNFNNERHAMELGFNRIRRITESRLTDIPQGYVASNTNRFNRMNMESRQAFINQLPMIRYNNHAPTKTDETTHVQLNRLECPNTSTSETITNDSESTASTMDTSSDETINQLIPRASAERCPICLDEYVDEVRLRLLPCLHRYHVDCIDYWLLNRKMNCPLCAREVDSNTNNLEF